MYLKLGKLMVFYTKNVMRLLLFLQRVTFICNLFFILFLIQYYNPGFISYHGDSSVTSSIVSFIENLIIILGFFIAFVLNTIINIWEVVLLFNHKIAIGPKWLRTFNFLIFLLQIVFHFV